MKIFVTGVGGQLGHDVVNILQKAGHDVVGSDYIDNTDFKCQYKKLDITDEKSVSEAIEDCSPDAVIHCAAWTAVDDAEDAHNAQRVFAVNEKATKYLAQSCKKHNCKMVYISTDYVFDKSGETPIDEDSEDFAPLNVYGKSKLAGEFAVKENLEKFFIIRTSWVFGKNGNNFIKTMLNLSKKYDTIRVVNDQIGLPTYTEDLARLIAEVITTEHYGVYHATNEGDFISWYDFACEIFRQADISINVTPVTTREYGISKAKRPTNSRLNKQKLKKNGFAPLPHWKDALSRYLEEIN